MRQGVTVRRVAHAEVMTFDNTRETLTDGIARNIYRLTRNKKICFKFTTS
jgi:hypothetical protein